MKTKERTRRESIKPISPAVINMASKARRPTQSPNKARRKVSSFGKSMPVSLGERNHMRKLRANKRHSALLIRRRRTTARPSKKMAQKVAASNNQVKDSKQKLLSIVTKKRLKKHLCRLYIYIFFLEIK